MAAIYFSITPEGLTASLDAANTGLALRLTHVSGHNAAGVEIGRWLLSGGIVEPNSNTLRFSSVMTSTSRKELYGLKLLGDGLVFATAVGASPLVVVDANIDFAPAFGLALGQIPVGSITVSTDPNAPLAIILMLQHVGAANPHPQYAMKAAFDSHVIQNGLEHGNILSLLNNLVSRFQGMLEFQYAIGCFYWTDQAGNPNTWLQPIIGYETFWRPIVGRSLMSIDPADSRIDAVGGVFGTMVTTLAIENLPPHDHADGDYNRLLLVNGAQTTDATDATGGEPNLGSAGTLQSVGESLPFNNVHPVYLSYCWQRYDPSLIPLRTIIISEDLLDLNLLDLFISIYGTPVLGERIKFVVEENVLVTASTTSNYAVVTGDWPPDSNLAMDVFGVVSGRGGDGADGLQQSASATSKRGLDGGPCILATYPISINNQNIVSGGGAGGGASANWRATAGTSSAYIGNVGGSGGVPYGQGGAAGTVTSDVVSWGDGLAGAAGDRTTAGGAVTRTETRIGATLNHVGGTGGGFGQSGGAGSGSGSQSGGEHTPNEWRAGGAGGLAGIAITGPVTVTGNPVLGR